MPRSLLNILEQHLYIRQKKVVIGISGLTGVGKSWLSNFLKKEMANTAVISADSFIEGGTSSVYDKDILVNYEKIETEIYKFLNGEKISSKRYCHENSQAILGAVNNYDVLIVEGGLIGAYLSKDLFDFSILLDTEDNLMEFFVGRAALLREYSEQKTIGMLYECVENFTNHRQNLIRNSDIRVFVCEDRTYKLMN
jgi:uridine kinase